MITFHIQRPNPTIEADIEAKINNKTKPLGALGHLEKIAKKIALVQQSLTPELRSPTILVFAADHGLTEEGISAFPKEVTHQMVLNFLSGGAAINVFARQHGIDLKIVDAGVAYPFQHTDLIDAKIGMGTNNSLHGPAMSANALGKCFENGKSIAIKSIQQGCNVMGFGEMGIGNTTSAGLIMHLITQLPLSECIGKGTGLNQEQLNTKLKVAKKVAAMHQAIPPKNVPAILAAVGGFEIAMMTAAMLTAAENKCVVLVDGFIATAAFLCAKQLYPEIEHYAIFCHESEEKGHQALLHYLNASPVLQLNMRLGEGTGCAMAYPIVTSSITFFNEMASFETAGVSNKA